ncbi:MAG: arginine N-succinyltransferase [Sphingomonadales bacterium]|nr:arginine N-succinyltransferase [Sphingomonadales bacterium]
MTFIIRPARMGDLQQIYEMAKRTGGGFTNLPPDRASLIQKLELSEKAFGRDDDMLSDDRFLFALENTETGQVRGTCQIFAKVGQKWPFYSYRIGALTQHSEELQRTFRADILNLSTDLEGATEVGGLFLHPGERSGGLGMLIARSRYLFIRMHRPRFADMTLAELRGVIDDAGGSPFWDSVAGRFFGMSFQDADEFNAKHGNQFIADLMPKHPVYIAMLSQQARAVIGVPHVSGRAAMRMLENEGFVWEKYVDIFDAGPTMTAQTDRIKSVCNSREIQIDAVADVKGREDAQKMLVAHGRLNDFKASYGWILEEEGRLTLDVGAAKALDIDAGATVCAMERNGS